MINTSFELNNERKDANYITNDRLHAHSAVVEVFSAMVNGEEVSKFGEKADLAVSYIKKLGEKAESGDYSVCVISKSGGTADVKLLKLKKEE